MSADLIRWLFCRHNPASNVNFGPKPAEELRSKFTLKLWNSYAFLCNYARLDGFDPAAPPLPSQPAPILQAHAPAADQATPTDDSTSANTDQEAN